MCLFRAVSCLNSVQFLHRTYRNLLVFLKHELVVNKGDARTLPAISTIKHLLEYFFFLSESPWVWEGG